MFAIAKVFFLEKFAKDSAIFIYTKLRGFFPSINGNTYTKRFPNALHTALRIGVKLTRIQAAS